MGQPIHRRASDKRHDEERQLKELWSNQDAAYDAARDRELQGEWDNPHDLLDAWCEYQEYEDPLTVYAKVEIAALRAETEEWGE